jgi:hypothetical protein
VLEVPRICSRSVDFTPMPTRGGRPRHKPRGPGRAWPIR